MSCISGDMIETFNVLVITEDTVYFDDDYNESATGWNNTHFDNIQDAVDAATDGDIVFVYNETYHENIIIKKSSINLIGKESNSTIIDDGGWEQ